ncbi:MTP-1 family protein [Paenibacillus sp. D51F]
MNTQKLEPSSCRKLLAEYRASGARAEAPERIPFAEVGEKDVYNIAAPIVESGRLVIPGRVESRDSEHSAVVFFEEAGGRWLPLEGAPVLELQDPFHCRIGGELVVGGVEIYPHPDNEGALMWRTVFYRGSGLEDLKPFFKGPDGMKDIRLVELADGEVGVFTRPQGEKGGRGKIGFAQAASLEQLTLDLIENAPLLEGQFAEGEWGGANEAHLLQDGRIGVLGHVACFDEAGDRHYYPMAFVFDPVSASCSELGILAERSVFLPGPAKRADLQDVVFSGGLLRRTDGTAVLYAGISDADAQRLVIDDPFAGL